MDFVICYKYSCQPVIEVFMCCVLLILSRVFLNMSFPEHTGPKTESEIHENKVEGDKLSCSSSSLKVGNISESGIAEEDQKVITPTKNSAGITARKSLPAELEPDKDNLGRLYNDQLGSNPGMPNKTAPSRRIPHLHKLEK